MKNIDNKLREYIKSLGLDTFGIIRYELDSLCTIISIAFPYNHLDTTNNNGFSIYTKRLDYHKIVRLYLNRICEFLIQNGYSATPYVDSNSLPEKHIAELAGVGFIGKNHLIITKKYGSYVFLGEIITDFVPQIIDFPIKNLCGSCSQCQNACPTNGINDTNKCISYLTQKKELTQEEINLLQGQIFGCDICQNICPHNKYITKSSIPEFKVLNYMEHEPSFYTNIDNRFFKNYIKQTSCGWRGKNVIIRNAQLAVKFNEKKENRPH
ncbi:hypothetical protein AN641_04975 [Candidatus Epulonipiscioides gigas]|nr:hypothetical protein AN641_04975 [Epulopiscium sp. SCG-C07WGA-EpuloA2]